ncbi:glycosyltransferase [Patescibacteria group bacterium]
MKIGFYLKWEIRAFSDYGMNVLGEELLARAYCKYLLREKGIKNANVYAPNHKPDQKLDYMIYLNDTRPLRRIAKKHILYLQNAYKKDSYQALKKLRTYKYDGYAFISDELRKLHNKDGFDGIFLPFGVDTEVFCPRKYDPEYDYEVSHVGNSYKGAKGAKKYLMPAINYKFGLFGRWGDPPIIILIGQKIPLVMNLWLRHMRARVKYNKDNFTYIFNHLCQGKIPQNNVPVLYSSSKINLNYTAEDSIKWNVITLRILEIIACKGFVITDGTAFARTELKDCVVCTSGGVDLDNKIKYYLSNLEERKRYAENGYKYIIKNATISKRVNTLLKYLKTIS